MGKKGKKGLGAMHPNALTLPDCLALLEQDGKRASKGRRHRAVRSTARRHRVILESVSA